MRKESYLIRYVKMPRKEGREKKGGARERTREKCLFLVDNDIVTQQRHGIGKSKREREKAARRVLRKRTARKKHELGPGGEWGI